MKRSLTMQIIRTEIDTRKIPRKAMFCFSLETCEVGYDEE